MVMMADPSHVSDSRILEFSITTQTKVLLYRGNDIPYGEGFLCFVNEEWQSPGSVRDGDLKETLKTLGGKEYETARLQLMMVHKKLVAGRIYHTPAGQFQSKIILHGAVPHFDSASEQAWTEAMQSIVSSVLEKLKLLQLTTLTIPIFGNGKDGGPPDKIVGILIQQIRKWLLSNCSSSLSMVSIVVMDDGLLPLVITELKACGCTMTDTEKEHVSSADIHFGSVLGDPRAVSDNKTKSGAELNTCIEQRQKTPMSSSLNITDSCLDDESELDFDNDFRDLHLKHSSNNDQVICPICMEYISPTNRKELPICRHVFCQTCVHKAFQQTKPACPSCNMLYDEFVGNQPDGTMLPYIDEHTHLPGYEDFTTIVIEYHIPGGIQTDRHPHPGTPFKGTRRQAFLPNNEDGQRILNLLQIAFERKLIFTVGMSVTTGKDSVVTWNDIHHKTRAHGGPSRFGYPDPGYLRRVEEELKQRGVVLK